MSDMLNRMPSAYEPMKKNRWVFTFPEEIGIQVWELKSAARPTISIDEEELQLFNTSTFVQGRYTFEPITLTLRNAIGKSTTQTVMEWCYSQLEPDTGRQGYAQGYKKDVNILMLDPTGVAIEKWILFGCWVTNYNFGELAMDDGSVAEITLELRYDRARLVY